MAKKEFFPLLSSNNPLEQIQKEASEANLELLKDSRIYLSIREIEACMLAWFPHKAAEFYRENDSWFTRGNLPVNQENLQKLSKYFDPENIVQTKNEEISYRGNLHTQKDLTDFVSDINSIINI